MEGSPEMRDGGRTEGKGRGEINEGENEWKSEERGGAK